MSAATKRRPKSASPGGLSNLPERRAAIERAELRLQQAVLDDAPACDGDLRFTGEDRTLRTALELEMICSTCQLAQTCADYAEAARVAGGFWAGSWRGSPERQEQTAERRRPAAEGDKPRELAPENDPREAALLLREENGIEEASA